MKLMYLLLLLLSLAPLAADAQQCYTDQYGNQICPQQQPMQWQQPMYQQQPQFDSGHGRQQRMVTDAPDRPQQRQQSQQPRPLPWRCRVDTDDGSRGSGSLICAGNGVATVITNWHVIRDSAGQAVATFPDGQRLAGSVIKYDDFYDLAALRIRDPGIKPAELDLTEPRGVLIAGGTGDGSSFRTVHGPITGYVYYGNGQNGVPMPKIRGAVRPGDSGGGVVSEARKFVGVVWGERDGETYLTCGAPLAKFVEECCRHCGNGTQPNGWTSSSSQPLTNIPPPLTGTPPTTQPVNGNAPIATTTDPAEVAEEVKPLLSSIESNINENVNANFNELRLEVQNQSVDLKPLEGKIDAQTTAITLLAQAVAAVNNKPQLPPATGTTAPARGKIYARIVPNK